MSAASFMARFQSTLPYGSETVAICSLQMTSISIHAPLRERPLAELSRLCPTDFNPRSLTGAIATNVVHHVANSISIHAPLRERTAILDSSREMTISIHAPLRERTFAQIIISREGNFNPRSLTGATVSDEILRTSLGFQSTLPYGSDLFVRHLCFRDTIFQSTLPYGSEEFADLPSSVRAISIHAPLRERLPYGSEASKQITSLLI